MGVLSGRDLYSSKYITAEISDATNRLHIVPIRHTIGSYFLVNIENKLYAFDLTDAQILTRRESLTKAFQVVRYDVRHYRSINDKVKELELALEKNSLPKVNGMLSNVFKILGSKEKKNNFESHKIEDLIKEISEYKNKKANSLLKKDSKYAEEAKTIVNFLDSLRIEEIVTPLRGISDFIESDLKSTDPSFMGNIITQFQRTDLEHKKVTNTPISAKRDWMKFMLVFMGVGIILAIGYIGYTEGWFDGITSMASPLGDINFNLTPPPLISESSIAAKYPTPESAKAAIDAGQAKITDFPPSMRPLIESVKTPTTNT